MAKKYYVRAEPYASRIKTTDSTLEVLGDVLMFDRAFGVNLAKATGLRSKKKRHLKKRFKKVIIQAIKEYAEECLKSQ